MATKLDSAAPSSPATPPTYNPARQMRRAWQVLLLSFITFAVLVGSVGVGLTRYRSNATRPRTAYIAQIITGTQASVRPNHQADFRELGEGGEIAEGDTVRTQKDTRLRVGLFDRTMIELSTDTYITFDRLRASQYLDRNATVVLHIERGRAIVTVSADPAFARTNITAITPTGTVQAARPGTSFSVIAHVDDQDGPAYTNVSVLNGTDIVVTGAGQQVSVATGQQSEVHAGMPPSAPQIKQRALVENGNFTLAPPLGTPASHWSRYQSDGGDGAGEGRAVFETVAEPIRGQPATTLHLVRSGGNVDNDQIGIEQVFSFGELDEFDSVTLSADIKVTSHSLSAGGEAGSEYPLIFLLRFKDSNLESHDLGRAFYMQNDANYRTRGETLLGQQVKQPGQWETFNWDLKQLVPAPYKLVSVRVYASGHDFDASVANISIVAK